MLWAGWLSSLRTRKPVLLLAAGLGSPEVDHFSSGEVSVSCTYPTFGYLCAPPAGRNRSKALLAGITEEVLLEQGTLRV